MDNIAEITRYVNSYDHYRERRAAAEQFGGEWVRFIRGISDMSLRKFSVKFGVSAAYLSKIERGIEPLSADLARQILEFCKTIEETKEEEIAA